MNAALDGVNAANITDANITGNNISKVGDDGVDVVGGSNVLVDDNVIDLVSKTAAPFDRDGISVVSVADLSVDNNTISNASRYGIHTNLITGTHSIICLLYTSPSPRDQRGSRMPSSA